MKDKEVKKAAAPTNCIRQETKILVRKGKARRELQGNNTKPLENLDCVKVWDEKRRENYEKRE
jgi:hypothetical protein